VGTGLQLPDVARSQWPELWPWGAMRQPGVGGHELLSWVRCAMVASQPEQEPLSNRSRGQCWEPLPGNAKWRHERLNAFHSEL
jgi:hypothetical protein